MREPVYSKILVAQTIKVTGAPNLPVVAKLKLNYLHETQPLADCPLHSCKADGKYSHN
jgi:hypothetical protein